MYGKLNKQDKLYSLREFFKQFEQIKVHEESKFDKLNKFGRFYEMAGQIILVNPSLKVSWMNKLDMIGELNDVNIIVNNLC